MATGSKRKKAPDATEESKPPKRVARTRKGKLEELPNMPLDILYEIFSYLPPVDILNLSRTNKAFRALLMDRSAAPFWKAARLNIPDLPEPFPGMSEPAFANLCFNSHCHVCLKPNIQEVIWEYRARLCHACKEPSTVSLVSLRGTDFQLHDRQLRLLPHIDAEVVGKTKRGSKDWIVGFPRIYVPDKEEIETAWNVLTDEAARDEFLKTQDKRFEEIRKHARVCEIWNQNKKKNRNQELHRIRRERYNAIVAKLVELGYQKDVTYAEENIWDKDSLEIHPFVRQSKPLTQRTWNNNCANLLEFIEQNITPQRLYDEYEDNITVCLSALRLAAHTRMAPKHRPFFPRLRDLVSFPEVKAMMNPFDTPEFDPQDVDKLVPIVDDLVVSWKADCQRQLEDCIRTEAPDIPEDIAIWDLAIANMVSCTDAICQDVLVEPWPNGVLHDCKYYGYPIKSNDEERFIDNDNPHTLARNKWYDNVMNTSLGYKWSMKYLRPLVHGVENIVKLCGKDPLQVTAAEMDQLDARFFCFDQEKEKGVREILTWREAATQESHRLRRNGQTADWKIVPEEDRKKIVHLELAAQQCKERSEAAQCYWCCARCDIMHRSRETLTMHIKERHEIETPGENDLFLDQERALAKAYVYIVYDARNNSPPGLPRIIQEAFKEGRAALESNIYGSSTEWISPYSMR